MLSNFDALQTDDNAEARRHASLALRILAGVWDQLRDVQVGAFVCAAEFGEYVSLTADPAGATGTRSGTLSIRPLASHQLRFCARPFAVGARNCLTSYAAKRR
jgi:hypothetical protein